MRRALAVWCVLPALALGAEAEDVTALSRNGSVRLTWTNPAAHAGILVVRSTAGAPNFTPTSFATYTAGQTVGNGTVAFFDTASATTFTDSGLTNGTRYYYRFYKRSSLGTYAAGNVPVNGGLSIKPTALGTSDERWCYATGLPIMTQPVIDPGAGVLAFNNGGKLASVATNVSNAALDGLERFRPLALAGAVTGRLSSVPLEGRVGRFGLVGDQTGKAYAVNLGTGATVWTGFGGLPIGDAIVGTPGVQLNAYANAAFKAANPSRDLIFIATRNLLGLVNRVVALSSVDGAQVWSYAPLNLDIVNGGMLVDYTNNRLWVVARSGSGTVPSVRVLNSLTGAQVAALSLGDIDTGVVKDFLSNQAYVVNNSGTAYGIDLASMSVVWNASVGATSSYLYPLGNGFIASVSSGTVQRWSVSGAVATQTWSTSVPGPSGITLDFDTMMLYVGASDGSLRKLSAVTGVLQTSRTISSDAVGMPTIDTTAARLVVGTLTGDLCAYGLPF